MNKFSEADVQEMIAKGDVQGLIQALDDYPIKSASALGRLRDKRAVEPLIAVLKSREQIKAHRAVVMALKEIGDERAAEPLAQALSDMDVVVRQEAAEALVRIGDERVVKQLTQALQDQNYVVRDYAAAALKRIGGEKELDSLVQNLENLHGEARWKAAEAILNIGGKKAVEPLLQLLKDESSKVRTIAARGLGSIGGMRAVEPLILVLKDVDSDVRTTAATALGRIGDARAVEPLILALKGQDAQVRWMAAEALGNIGDKRAVEPLTIALKDESIGVKSKAKEALVKIRSVPPPRPGVGEEIQKSQEIAQKSIWRITVGAFLTFIGVGLICMLLSGESTDNPVAAVCLCLPIMLVFGPTLLWQGITGKGIPGKSKTTQSPSKGIPSISKLARSPSQPEAEPSWVKSLAIASLVLSISALPASVVGCGLFFPFLAVIFGLISYVQAKKSNSPRNIRLIALAGAIFGGLLIILLAILLVTALIWQNT